MPCLAAVDASRALMPVSDSPEEMSLATLASILDGTCLLPDDFVAVGTNAGASADRVESIFVFVDRVYNRCTVVYQGPMLTGKKQLLMARHVFHTSVFNGTYDLRG